MESPANQPKTTDDTHTAPKDADTLSNNQPAQAVQPGAQVARFTPGQKTSLHGANDTIDVFATPAHTTETLLHDKKHHHSLLWVVLGIILILVVIVVIVWRMQLI